MEIHIENKEILREFNKHFFDQNLEKSFAAIKITSLDKQDKGRIFNIFKKDIISIEQDCQGMIIWWKEWSFLEGKFFTNSNHFKKYLLNYGS